MEKISILIPYYNEIDNIRTYHDTLFPVIDPIMKEYGYECEYVFYNDGSTDGGSNIFDAFYYIESLNLIKHHGCNTNEGLGLAIRNGIQYCDGDYIIVLDADLSYKPDVVENLIRYLRKGVDCISTSPYQKYSDVQTSPSFMRYMGSIGFNLMYSLAIGRDITCVTSMVRLYKSSVIKNMTFKSKGFDINAEILSELLLKEYSVIEIPAKLYKRKYGISKMNVLLEAYRGVKMVSKIILRRHFNYK